MLLPRAIPIISLGCEHNRVASVHTTKTSSSPKGVIPLTETEGLLPQPSPLPLPPNPLRRQPPRQPCLSPGDRAPRRGQRRWRWYQSPLRQQDAKIVAAPTPAAARTETWGPEIGGRGKWWWWWALMFCMPKEVVDHASSRGRSLCFHRKRSPFANRSCQRWLVVVGIPLFSAFRARVLQSCYETNTKHKNRPLIGRRPEKSLFRVSRRRSFFGP